MERDKNHLSVWGCPATTVAQMFLIEIRCHGIERVTFYSYRNKDLEYWGVDAYWGVNKEKNNFAIYHSILGIAVDIQDTDSLKGIKPINDKPSVGANTQTVSKDLFVLMSGKKEIVTKALDVGLRTVYYFDSALSRKEQRIDFVKVANRHRAAKKLLSIRVIERNNKSDNTDIAIYALLEGFHVHYSARHMDITEMVKIGIASKAEKRLTVYPTSKYDHENDPVTLFALQHGVSVDYSHHKHEKIVQFVKPHQAQKNLFSILVREETANSESSAGFSINRGLSTIMHNDHNEQQVKSFIAKYTGTGERRRLLTVLTSHPYVAQVALDAGVRVLYYTSSMTHLDFFVKKVQ